MWKLCHKLFGWQYVVVYNGWYRYIRRVCTAPNGRQYVRLYGEVHFIETIEYEKLT